MANMFMRATFSIIYRDSEFKNTNEMQDFVAGIVNATSTDKDDILTALKQYAKENPEKMQELNITIKDMAEPLRPLKSGTNSTLTPDVYKSYGPYKGD
jgi:predicted Zn-dependent protease